VTRIGARHSAVGGAAPDGRRRRWRAAQALAVIAAAGLVAAGCGGSDEGGGGNGSEAGAASDPAVAYAECMRENGVPEFPDPVNGQLQLQATPGSGLDPNSPEFKRAQKACQDLAPAGAEAGASPDPDLQAQVLDYAKCIRKNGVPEFPDPDFSGGGVIMQLPPGVDQNSEQFQSAQQACQDRAPQGGLGGGQ
jgi:hypothetical protein